MGNFNATTTVVPQRPRTAVRKSLMNRYYIGLACTMHDPALAIVNPDGEVLFAEATERHTQVKRAFNMPADNLDYIGSMLQKYCRPDADLIVAKTWTKHFERGSKLLDVLMSPFYLLPKDAYWAPLADTLRLASRANAHSVAYAGESLRFMFRQEANLRHAV